MPSDKPFFANLPEIKKVITPTGEVLVRKKCKCGAEFMGKADQTRCEKCLEKKQNGNESGVFVFFCFFLTSHAVANAGHQMFAFVDLPRSTT
jgi:hypothetical protein